MSNKKIQTLKGFRDIFPKEAKKREWLRSKIIQVFERWGYKPFETPTLEPLDLFEGQIGEDEKLFYKFTDHGGRNVALRYDQTVPICRVMGQYKGQLYFPFKRYQIQPAFRAEKPQKGRYREFLQCDADIFGVKSPYADAEVIALSLDIYKEIGFKNPKVLINDRTLFKDIPYEAIVAIDKLEKIGEKGVIRDMEKKDIDKSKAQEYLDYVANIEPNDTIQIILDYLESYGFDKSWYEFDPTIARSFSYSDGPIWEVKIKEYKVGSVLGGERFDNLTNSISGVDVPGTGFGLGFDRTLEAADQLELIPIGDNNNNILMSAFDDKTLKKSLKIVNKLRAEGLTVDIYPNPSRDFKKQFKYADKNGYKYVIILGEDELKNNKISLKNMRKGEQKLLDIDDLLKILS
ncbi:histidine--tRNA ligase [Candidatus Dojkabacteria bacterium]|nr:histidine--tRNA ligase [Candidatus Dojkabacteria bacterium]